MCPICEEVNLVLVTYVFGPRLPAHGRCVSTKDDLAKLNGREEDLDAYVVEACTNCRWHHLLRVLPLGGQPVARRAPMADPVAHLFVYGTLRPGEVRWRFLEPFVVDEGVADAAIGQLFDTGLGYPAATFAAGDESGTIHGRTFEPRRPR